MFELSYETNDGMLIIHMRTGSLKDVTQELSELDIKAFREENAPEDYDDGYFKISPC